MAPLSLAPRYRLPASRLFLFPGAGVLGQLAVQPQSGPVLGDPGRQPGPGGQERLVRDLHAIGVGGDQPRLGEPVQHRRCQCDPGRVGAGADRSDPGEHLGPGHAAAGELALRADVDQPQQYPPGRVHASGREVGADAFGLRSDRAVDAAGVPVPGHGQGVPRPPVPGCLQRVRQQRQCPRLVAGDAGPQAQVGDHQFGQPGFDRAPACSAGSVMARRRSSSASGPTTTWLPANSSPRPARLAQSA